MTGEKGRFRPIETAPEWSREVFDTCAELAELLERHSYRFARTMPGAPHSYTLKRTWLGEDEFVEALRKMRSVERIEEFFRGYWYRRFNANGYKYWTMGASLDHILINRAIHASLSILMRPIAIPTTSRFTSGNPMWSGAGGYTKR